jgi:copper chaperone CopZ
MESERVKSMNTPRGYTHLLLREKLMADSLRLSIEGMHCDGCVRRVSAALQAIEGVELGPVEVGSAEMTFDPGRTSAGEIASAVNRIGFTAHINKQ